ncbi:MAG TPA: hypothetical protein VMG12_14595 [Polyangiaceae bacterium]|nr:hypothetical protein [Polyangiaceae bacterium]
MLSTRGTLLSCVEIMHRVRRPWAVLGLLYAAHGVACGGEGAGAAAASRIEPPSSPPWAEANCTDVGFVRAPDEATGLVVCERSVWPPDVYAVRVEACGGRGQGKSAYGPIPCAADAECPAGATCGKNRVCYLSAACDTDADCGAGEACICAGNVGNSAVVGYNQCVSAGCRSDADCGGYACAVSNVDPCGKLSGMFCHGAADECAQHSDCDRRACGYVADVGAWRCVDDANFTCDEGLFGGL